MKACALLLLLLAFTLQPAEPEARWWRGNMHTHSAWAEGDDFPEMIAAAYKDRGYNFLVLTEHNLLSQGMQWKALKDLDAKAKTGVVAPYLQRFGASWVETRDDREVRLKTFEEFSPRVNEDGRFLVIPGEEITDQAANGHAIHMNASNLTVAVKPRSGASVRETIAHNLAAVSEASKGRDVMVAVNHPNYKWGVTPEDLAASEDLRFFEIWNGVTDDNDPGDPTHPSTDEIWDRANALRLANGFKPLYGLANDDAHNYHGTNPRAIPGRAWVMVRARTLTPEALFSAMRDGHFYASTGVTLNGIFYDSKTRRLSLDIDASGGGRFVTRFIGLREGQTEGEQFAEEFGNHPEYTMGEGEIYVRAIVTSDRAPEVPSPEFPFRRAWTQPVGWQ